MVLLLDTSHKERRKQGKEGKKGQERDKNNYSKTKQTKKENTTYYNEQETKIYYHAFLVVKDY